MVPHQRWPGVLLALLFALSSARGQTGAGQWALGLQGGVNVWAGDYDGLKAGAGGIACLRYSVSRSFSLGLQSGYEDLRTVNSFVFPGYPDNYQHLQAIPLQLVARYTVNISKSLSPYVFAGGGIMFYRRRMGDGSFYPDDKYSNSFSIPVGVGLEIPLSKNAQADVDGGFTFIDNTTDLWANESLDGYMTLKVGLSFLIGSNQADDDDEDGLTNGQEQSLGTNPDVADSDGDGLTDGDEVKRYKTNPLARDSDGDGLDDGDEVRKHSTSPVEADTDGDGLTDGDEVLRRRTNPLRLDTDSDGLSDGEEALRLGTNPVAPDTDGDGLPDGDEEKIYHTLPTSRDTDKDGLSDGEEAMTYHTDPLKIDSDAGGIHDGAEVRRGSNPLVPADDSIDYIDLLEPGRPAVLKGVTFPTGTARLTPSAEEALERAYAALLAHPDIRVEVAGHTDDMGDARRNERLSIQRAEAVRDWLIRRGITPSRLTAIGYGGRFPLVPNTTAENRAKNRRIEFKVQ